MGVTEPKRFWIMGGGLPEGPFPADEVRRRLAGGIWSGAELACPLGESRWLPLLSIAEFGPPPAPAGARPPGRPELPTVNIPPPVADRSPIQQSAAASAGADWTCRTQQVVDAQRAFGGASRAGLPWDPVAILVLGTLFTPTWAGVMASINGRRLGARDPNWVALAVGIGWLPLALALSWSHVGLLDLLLYASALAALWILALAPQRPLFAADPAARERGQGAWAWPSLAGLPLALVPLAMIVTLFLPDEPREVCDHFLNATSAAQMAKYTTAKMRPACEALARYAESGADEGQVELTDESSAPPDVGGRLVGWRVSGEDGAQYYRVEGVFHLVDWQGRWLIDEMALTSVNGQAAEPWLLISRDYAQLDPQRFGNPSGAARAAGRWTPAGATTSTAPVSPSADTFWGGVYRWMKKNPRAWLFLLVAAGGALSAHGRRRFAPRPPS